jgi:hypothetical protein
MASLPPKADFSTVYGNRPWLLIHRAGSFQDFENKKIF